jgi:hypothetical protein
VNRYRAPQVIPPNEYQDEQNQFDDYRIPELHRRVNDHLEPREYLFSDDVPVNELSHDQTQPLVHQKFGNNEKRQSHQKTGMHFYVIQER